MMRVMPFCPGTEIDPPVPLLGVPPDILSHFNVNVAATPTSKCRCPGAATSLVYPCTFPVTFRSPLTLTSVNAVQSASWVYSPLVRLQPQSTAETILSRRQVITNTVRYRGRLELVMPRNAVRLEHFLAIGITRTCSIVTI